MLAFTELSNTKEDFTEVKKFSSTTECAVPCNALFWLSGYDYRQVLKQNSK